MSTAISPAFGEKKSGELIWSTNNKVMHVYFDPPKSTFFPKTIYRPLRGAAPSNFFTRAREWQMLANTNPKQFLLIKIQKIPFKFSALAVIPLGPREITS